MPVARNFSRGGEAQISENKDFFSTYNAQNEKQDF